MLRHGTDTATMQGYNNGTHHMVPSQPSQMNPAQERFNSSYISASEIARECQVSRPSVMRARERGALPNAICVGEGNIYIWERQAARPYIDAWKITLRAKRGQIA